ncbi:hypothetical protein NDU88_004292 [Pleurodeles waltl]|uniref:Uncharacterized protein n=1 Tax=Pleurodeles waltl TaxID=8319 RepID=A0AAV7QBU8_PLEWA|nr:hypothetical protein NDU88_004292 [Pleurodeles waltl]
MPRMRLRQDRSVRTPSLFLGSNPENNYYFFSLSEDGELSEFPMGSSTSDSSCVSEDPIGSPPFPTNRIVAKQAALVPTGIKELNWDYTPTEQLMGSRTAGGPEGPSDAPTPHPPMLETIFQSTLAHREETRAGGCRFQVAIRKLQGVVL